MCHWRLCHSPIKSVTFSYQLGLQGLRKLAESFTQTGCRRVMPCCPFLNEQWYYFYTKSQSASSQLQLTTPEGFGKAVAPSEDHDDMTHRPLVQETAESEREYSRAPRSRHRKVSSGDRGHRKTRNDRQRECERDILVLSDSTCFLY